MKVIAVSRARELHSFEDLARRIEDVGRNMYDRGEVRYEFKITADEVRAMLQGMTKSVPLWVVIFCAHIYRINQGVLFDFLSEY
ncbi:MAG: hypothetical protein LC723_06410 [Actinobacteria bacterium]|nr:hypothetical protein [Actinomycetota bacterium]